MLNQSVTILLGANQLFFMRDTRIQRNICEFNADSSYSIVIQIQ